MKRYLQLFAACFLFIINVSAQTQQPTSITGKVTASGKPVEAASLSLLKTKDSSLIKLELSDEEGKFEFNNIKTGSYFLQANVVGYKIVFTPVIEVSSTNANIHLNEIELTEDQKELAGVSVTVVKPLIENKIDKTVVNVDAAPTNAGLSALEVLEKSPGVTVDNDGNIKLKGKQGVIIMIGKFFIVIEE